MKINIEDLELEADAVLGATVEELENGAIETKAFTQGKAKPIWLINAIARIVIQLGRDLDMDPDKMILLILERVSENISEELIEEGFKELIDD